MLKAHFSILSRYRSRNVVLRKGATLLEMTIWLLIFVGIIVAVLATASMVLSQNAAAQETQTVTQLTTEARKLRTARGYTTTIVEDMRSMRSIPTTVMDPGENGSILYNSWGGEITFTQIDSGANFLITYTNIPQVECIQLVQSIRAGILQSIAKGDKAAPTLNLVNLTPSIIETDLCDTQNGNEITWSTKVI